MKSTEPFKAIIMEHLRKRASEDMLFAITLKKPGKNIEDCISYILNTVHKSGVSAFADEEVFSMALHYYDEDNIPIGGKPKECHIVKSTPKQANTEEMWAFASNLLTELAK